MSTKKEELKKQPSVYMFIHPGGEHYVKKRLKLPFQNNNQLFFKEWNGTPKNTNGKPKRSNHARKNIRIMGEYINGNGEEKPASLDFWGEWEAYSVAVAFKEKHSTSNSNKTNLAKYYHMPFMLPEKTYKGDHPIGIMIQKILKSTKDTMKKENTDPFVFDDCFMYSSICNPKGTCNIPKGSILLFGSFKKDEKKMELSCRYGFCN